jgi:hypothetical protein
MIARFRCDSALTLCASRACFTRIGKSVGGSRGLAQLVAPNARRGRTWNQQTDQLEPMARPG